MSYTNLEGRWFDPSSMHTILGQDTEPQVAPDVSRVPVLESP